MQEGLDAIAHPGRRAMLTLLLAGERSAGELAQRTGMRQPVASQHLRVLRDAGLVSVRKDGNRRVYSVDFESVGRLRRELDAFWQPSLAALKEAVESTAGPAHPAVELTAGSDAERPAGPAAGGPAARRRGGGRG